MHSYKTLQAINAANHIVVLVFFMESSCPERVTDYVTGFECPILGHVDALGLLTVRHPMTRELYSVFYRAKSIPHIAKS